METVDQVRYRLIEPLDDERELAESASRALARAKNSNVRVRLDDQTELQLPRSVKELLVRILTEISHGNMVNLVPIHAELTTQEAANLLNVSRPYLVKLLNEGKLPFHKVGTHRRIKFVDLRAFRQEFDDAREKSLKDLAKQSQELDLGY